MLVNITVNQNGFIGVWLDEPKRLKNVWKGKFPFVNYLVYKKIKNIVKESQMNWESDFITIPLN